MEPIIGQPPDAGIPATSDASFVPDVIEASRSMPIVVAFGPGGSRQLIQLTEALSAAIRGHGNGIGLYTLDTDKNQQVVAQIGLRQVPSVIGFVGGSPADGFNGVKTDRAIQDFIKKLAGAVGPSAADMLMDQGWEALEAGDSDRAAALFDAFLQSNPGSLKAIAGLARASIKGGQLDHARATLDQVPEAQAGDIDIAAARSALELAEQVSDAGDIGQHRETVAANPDDLQARYDLALACLGGGANEEAARELLTIVGRDRDWNDGAARLKLLALFNTLGLQHPLSVSARRELSSILFS